MINDDAWFCLGSVLVTYGLINWMGISKVLTKVYWNQVYSMSLSPFFSEEGSKGDCYSILFKL